MKTLKILLQLFISTMKIGLFTFGGGYAMIHLLENEFVEKKQWLESEEFIDLVAIAESTPGPIAINCSTYIGYKRAGVLGAVCATLGICIPSFVIVYLISLFFNQFLAISWVASAFKGIQVCVIFLVASAGVRMLKKIKKTLFNVIVFLATLLTMVAFNVFSVSFSSIFYILISALVGVTIYAVQYARKKWNSSSDKGEE